HFPGIGMQNMWTVLMPAHAVFIDVIVHVAADMSTFFQHQHPLAAIPGITLRHDAAGKTGADHDDFRFHCCLPPMVCPCTSDDNNPGILPAESAPTSRDESDTSQSSAGFRYRTYTAVSIPARFQFWSDRSHSADHAPAGP